MFSDAVGSFSWSLCKTQCHQHFECHSSFLLSKFQMQLCAWEYLELLTRAETGGGPSYAIISHPSALGRIPTSPVFFFLIIRWAEVLKKPFNSYH